jgi:hypothetical protein
MPAVRVILRLTFLRIFCLGPMTYGSISFSPASYLLFPIAPFISNSSLKGKLSHFVWKQSVLFFLFTRIHFQNFCLRPDLSLSGGHLCCPRIQTENMYNGHKELDEEYRPERKQASCSNTEMKWMQMGPPSFSCFHYIMHSRRWTSKLTFL